MVSTCYSPAKIVIVWPAFLSIPFSNFWPSSTWFWGDIIAKGFLSLKTASFFEGGGVWLLTIRALLCESCPSSRRNTYLQNYLSVVLWKLEWKEFHMQDPWADADRARINGPHGDHDNKRHSIWFDLVNMMVHCPAEGTHSFSPTRSEQLPQSLCGHLLFHAV